MYVKVTSGNHSHGQRGDFLCEVDPPIYSDHISVKLTDDAKWEPSEGNATGRALVEHGIDFEAALNAHIDFLHLLEFNPEQTDYEIKENMVSFRYVWWHDEKTGLTAVITTRNIFILGANGKTIDRV